MPKPDDAIALASDQGSRRAKVVSLGVHIVDILGRTVEALPEGGGALLIDEIRMTVDIGWEAIAGAPMPRSRRSWTLSATALARSANNWSAGALGASRRAPSRPTSSSAPPADSRVAAAVPFFRLRCRPATLAQPYGCDRA
jgi:hypothetical protein